LRRLGCVERPEKSAALLLLLLMMMMMMLMRSWLESGSHHTRTAQQSTPNKAMPGLRKNHRVFAGAEHSSFQH
jgi:hypothetical protein